LHSAKGEIFYRCNILPEMATMGEAVLYKVV